MCQGSDLDHEHFQSYRDWPSLPIQTPATVTWSQWQCIVMHHEFCHWFIIMIENSFRVSTSAEYTIQGLMIQVMARAQCQGSVPGSAGTVPTDVLSVTDITSDMQRTRMVDLSMYSYSVWVTGTSTGTSWLWRSQLASWRPAMTRRKWTWMMNSSIVPGSTISVTFPSQVARRPSGLRHWTIKMASGYYWARLKLKRQRSAKSESLLQSAWPQLGPAHCILVGLRNC